MDADHVEALVADGREAVRRCRPDYDYVTAANNDLFPIDDHRRLAGEHETGFGIGMFVQSRTFSWRQVAIEEGNASTIWFAFELDFGDWAFPLIAWFQDLKHLFSSRCWTFCCTLLIVMTGGAEAPE
jgi:hypothetical protein